jgi:PilX N-terminal
MKSLGSQRGAAALAVSMVLLFGMTLVAFFANRTMIFEQRTSANQYRSTKAFELADAGIEWAIARLNDDLTLAAASCTPSSATLSDFRDRYLRPMPPDATHSSGWLDPVSNTFPGCVIDPAAGTLSCGCPAVGGGAATLGNSNFPRFRVQFNATSDPTAVEIVSRGCSNGDPCQPSLNASSSDATAIARVLVKIRPTLTNGPNAGLISGSTTVVSGSLNVVNTDTPGNGITINTGSNVNLSGSGVSVVTIPGTPPAASILDNDPSLLKLTNADASGELFFSSFFGEGFTDFKNSLKTVTITAGAAFNSGSPGKTCSGAINCGTAVSYWVDQGMEQFWVDPDITFNSSNMPTKYGGTLGDDTHPIFLSTAGQLTTTGGIVAYGMFYAATASAIDDLTLSGGGSSTIIGALISRGDFARTGNGNISIVYKASLFGGGAPSGLLAPVPGSWRDKATAY